jgi:pimeloyl-ACP methyl ester carboxylesterase
MTSASSVTRWPLLVDAHRRDVQVHDSRMHIVDLGRGDPVVLLHGWGGSTFCWHENLSALLEAGYRAVLIDQPGMGRSARPPPPYVPTIENQADRVVGALEALGIDRFHLVGHSMGGAVSLAIAYRHPQRVVRLVVASAPCRPGMRCRLMGYPCMGHTSCASGVATGSCERSCAMRTSRSR